MPFFSPMTLKTTQGNKTRLLLLTAALLPLLTQQALAEGSIAPKATPANSAKVAKATDKKQSTIQSASSSITSSVKLSAEDKKQVQRIESYIGAMKTVAASFSQVSPDGALSTGKFYLQRPGKLRMEYDPPVPVLVICRSGLMIYYDKELDQITHVPLDSTLVTFLIRDKVSFDSSVTITHFEKAFKVLRLELVQTKQPKDGSMMLEFSDEPLVLRNIIVTDSGGQSTTVSLTAAKFDEKLAPELFVFKDPHLAKPGHIKK